MADSETLFSFPFNWPNSVPNSQFWKNIVFFFLHVTLFENRQSTIFFLPIGPVVNLEDWRYTLFFFLPKVVQKYIRKCKERDFFLQTARDPAVVFIYCVNTILFYSQNGHLPNSGLERSIILFSLPRALGQIKNSSETYVPSLSLSLCQS